MNLFWACLGAYLTGWLLVNLVGNRLLARATKNAERLEGLKTVGREQLAAAIVDELERRKADVPNV